MPVFTHRAIVPVIAAVALFSTAMVPSQACLNDRDTDSLADENRALPGMVAVITGRFERNPPLYYRMRIDRIAKEFRHHPADLPLYDDIAVAYDRLGDSGRAMEWMAKKRQQLEAHSPQLPGAPLVRLPESWYRYYANTGTFRVHRWLRDGADRKRIAAVKQARAEIAKAIAIKPDAHFGRETYQLQVMDWIVAEGRLKGNPDHGELGDFLVEKNKQPIAEGLAGLVVLGNAWESVDVFMALEKDLIKSKSAVLAYLATLRALELAKAGKKSLLPARFIDADRSIEQRIETRIGRVQLPARERLTAKYSELRTEADAWQKARATFMMQRLAVGRHPDTDPTFWNGYQPEPAPSLSTGAFAEWRDKTVTVANISLAIAIPMVGIPTFLVVRAIVLWWRRRYLDGKS